MKILLTVLKDLGLLLILGAFLIGSILGVRIPYRHPFIGTGDYQLEVFPTGMAVFQYNRVSPFYRILPVNDGVVSEEPKYKQIIETVLTFFRIRPLEYRGQQAMLQDDGWIRIDQTATSSALILKYNASDTVEEIDDSVRITNYSIPGTLVMKSLRTVVNSADQLVELSSPVFVRGEK